VGDWECAAAAAVAVAVTCVLRTVNGCSARCGWIKQFVIQNDGEDTRP
jgi:hypothetical protein